jgi:hypothetical protein
MLHAGLDWSGTPDLNGTDRKHDPYIVCVAAVENPEKLPDAFTGLRSQFNMSAYAEFHGHQMSDMMLCAFIEMAIAQGIYVCMLPIDKAQTRSLRLPTELPNPSTFQVLTAMRALDAFVARYSLQELRFDEDINGKERQQKFITEVKRMHRGYWPDVRVKVQPMKSHQSELIQLADVLAYSYGSLIRGSVSSPELRKQLKTIQAEDRNIVMEPMPWNK